LNVSLCACGGSKAGPPDELVAQFDYAAEAALAVEEVGVEQRDAIIIRDITFAVPNGERVSAYLVLPNGEGPFPAVLYVHWLGQSFANRRQFLDEALLLANEGVASLLVDDIFSVPGSRRSWRASTAEDDREEVVQQVVELRRAIDLLITEANADPKRIAIVGHDFGGMFGIVLVGVDERIKTCVAMTAVPDFSDWFLIQSSLKAEERDAYRAGLQSVAPVQYAGYVTPASLFLQFARVDGYVSEEQANALFEAANEPKRIEWYGASHALHKDEDATDDRLAWLRKELGLGE
jgi:dipeptidyl aminopeptidase/acylaminoacyl peptidase